MRRRDAVLFAVGLLALGAGCGEARLEITRPAQEQENRDCSFRGAVMETFAERHCGNANCHGTPYTGELQLVSADLDAGEIHHLLVSSGGSLQRAGDCENEWEGCMENPTDPPPGEFCCVRDVRPGFPGQSLLLQKPYSESTEPHSGAKEFTSDQDDGYLAIECWIANGAPND